LGAGLEDLGEDEGTPRAASFFTGLAIGLELRRDDEGDVRALVVADLVARGLILGIGSDGLVV
jgi:hypothetical protein